MIRILKHLGKSWICVPIVLALLIVQAACDLALPQYTSDIVDVGIQQGGIENAALDEIRGESFEKLLMFEDKISKWYSNEQGGNYEQGGGTAKLSASDKNEKEYAVRYITYPAAVVYALDHMDSSMMPDTVHLPEGMTVTDVLLAMPEEQRALITEEINKQFEGYSEVIRARI